MHTFGKKKKQTPQLPSPTHTHNTHRHRAKQRRVAPLRHQTRPEDSARGVAKGTEPVQDGPVEPDGLRDFGVGVQGVVVPREPVQQGLLPRGRLLDHRVRRGVAWGRHARRERGALALEAGDPSEEGAADGHGDELAVFVGETRLLAHERALALVVDALQVYWGCCLVRLSASGGWWVIVSFNYVVVANKNVWRIYDCIPG